MVKVRNVSCTQGDTGFDDLEGSWGRKRGGREGGGGGEGFASWPFDLFDNMQLDAQGFTSEKGGKGGKTSCPINLVYDDAVGLAGPHHCLHLASVGNVGVQGGSCAVVTGINFHRPVSAVPRYHMSEGRLAQTCGGPSCKPFSNALVAAPYW